MGAHGQVADGICINWKNPSFSLSLPYFDATWTEFSLKLHKTAFDWILKATAATIQHKPHNKLLIKMNVITDDFHKISIIHSM